jgi:hypothetical protein
VRRVIAEFAREPGNLVLGEPPPLEVATEIALLVAAPVSLYGPEHVLD